MKINKNMKQQPILTYLNNKFNDSSFKIKIELYILPLMFFYLSYYLLINTNNEKESMEIRNSIDLSQYENKKFEGSFLELFSSIENSAKQLNMQVKSLNNKINIVELKVDGKKEDIAKLIKKIENINHFTQIDSINVYGKNSFDIYSFDFKIDLNKYYIKKLHKEEENQVITTKANYELKAIIANYILINDKWMKIGENIDDLQLIDINKNFVILENDNQKLKLELVNEEYLKNIY